MRKFSGLLSWLLSGACILLLNLHSTSHAAAIPTRQDAVKRVKQAVLYYKQHGREKAIAEMNNPNSPLNQGGIYMFGMLFDEGLTEPIHPNPKIRGKPMAGLQDADGRYLIREMVDTCRKHGRGWVDYKWPNQDTNTVELKSSYVEKVGDMCLGAGIFTGK